jgi:hypothetical protein
MSTGEDNRRLHSQLGYVPPEEYEACVSSSELAPPVRHEFWSPWQLTDLLVRHLQTSTSRSDAQVVRGDRPRVTQVCSGRARWTRPGR